MTQPSICEPRTQEIGGIQFRVATPETAVDQVIELALAGVPAHIHLANAYTLALADRDLSYRVLLREGAVYPDGKPITWFSQLFRQCPRVQQIRGPRLFTDVLDDGRIHGLRHFLLGASEETLASLRTLLLRRSPGLEIVGTHSPPFRPLSASELEEQDSLIRGSSAQVVWVGLGTPKQDKEAQRLAASLGIPAVAVGAAFDFAAGTVRTAPEWMQRAGLEWVFRLLSEPRRLWRRYLFGNLRFIWSVLKHALARRRNR